MSAVDRLLTPVEVARLFRVDRKTVTRWGADGRLSSIRTPGGHHRFRESEVLALLAGDEPQQVFRVAVPVALFEPREPVEPNWAERLVDPAPIEDPALEVSGG